MFTITDGLPRELARLCVDCWQGADQFDSIVEGRYLKSAQCDFYWLIRKLFNKPVEWKPGAPATLLERSLVFAHRLYAKGDGRMWAPMEWQNSGLVVEDKNRGHVMLCKAAELALCEVFEDHDVVSLALELFASHPATRWKALELLLVYRARRVPETGGIGLQQWNLKNVRQSLFYTLDVNEVVHQSAPVAGTRFPVTDMQPGQLLALWCDHAVVDYVFLAHDSSRLFFFALSTFSYADHHARLEDLFEAEVFTSEHTVYEYYRRAVSGHLALPPAAADQTSMPAGTVFVFVTTSNAVMRKTKPGAHFNADVWLVNRARLKDLFGPMYHRYLEPYL